MSEMNDNADKQRTSGGPELSTALRSLRASYRETTAPAALEAATLAQMRAARERVGYERMLGLNERKLALNEHKPALPNTAHETKRASRLANWWNAITANRWTSALAGSVATIALATITAPLWLSYARESVEVATPFMLVSEPQTAQLDVSQMLRVNVTREAMLDFGIPVPPQRLQEQVKAEMLMGQRGELLAVRFIEPQREKRWRWQMY
jgi:hypothetical protein